MTTNPKGTEWKLHDQLTDRDLACHFLANLDYDSQLRAVVSLLASHHSRSAAVDAEIMEIEECAKRTSGMRNQQAVDEWVDRLQSSVYQDAAHSMAAVGMLAPFIESIFHQGLLAIGERLADLGQIPSTVQRFTKVGQKFCWDCHRTWHDGRPRKDLVEGIIQLSDAVRISRHFPADLRRMLTALFQYRNKMFHNGLEWPQAQRNAFDKNRAEWPPEWFASSTRDDKTWIVYLTDTFIHAWLDALDKIIEAFGKFARELIDADQRQDRPIYDYSDFLAARKEEDDGCSST
jgi:hypothetical protein